MNSPLHHSLILLNIQSSTRHSFRASDFNESDALPLIVVNHFKAFFTKKHVTGEREHLEDARSHFVLIESKLFIEAPLHFSLREINTN